MKFTGAVLGSLSSVVVRAVAVTPEMLKHPLTEANVVHLEDELEKAVGTSAGTKRSPLFGDLAKMIEDIMAPGILTAHSGAQSQLDGFRDAFAVCGTPDVSTDSSGVTSKAIGDKLEEHRQCRIKEGTAATDAATCNDELAKQETVKKSACSSVPGSDGSPPPLDKDGHVGCKVTPGDYEGWLNSFSHQIAQLKTQYDEAAGGCGNASKLADDARPKCQAANSSAETNKTACDGIQAAADTMGCSNDPAAHATCNAYDLCYDNAKQNYLDANESIAEAQVNRTVQWRVLKRMQCLLAEESQGATHDGIDACKEQTIDTSHLDLVYPIVPAKVDCSVPSGGPKPCSAEWVQQYGTALAAPCTPCVTTTTTTWVLLFRQTVPKQWTQNEWSLNADDPSNENYAILDQLESFRFYGQFEFKLVWPGFEAQVWRQSSNPVLRNKRGVDNYEAVWVPYIRNEWGGLENNLGKDTLLDGSVNAGSWWYAVGAKTLFGGGKTVGEGYPGPNGKTVTSVELYVKMGNYPAGDGSWPLVCRQTIPFLFTQNLWSLSPGQPTSANFAMLDQLEKFRSVSDGKFEFKLVWPLSNNMDQIWKQSSNPVTMTTRGVEGYEAVAAPYTSNNWGGLENNMGKDTNIDGSVGSGHWWYSVAAKALHGGGYPGPNGKKVLAVELYVKNPETAVKT